MESCCRACSRSDDFRRFSLYAVAEVSQEVIANMIRDTSDTQVSTEDGLPQHICPDCLMTLSLAYSFRKQCRRSEAKFREYWGRRTPAQSVDQQQQQQHQSQQQNLPRRSQSQVPDDSSFEAVATNIKEEVDIYDYEYSVPSVHDNQWVIQNPRTIGEGAMTVVHNTGGQYYDEAATSGEPAGAPDREGQGMIHAMDDAPEMGESSGLGLKAGDKLKKNVPNPERYSQRIRRQVPPKFASKRKMAVDNSVQKQTMENSEMTHRRQYKTYTKKQLLKAVEAVQKDMTYREAASLFNVPCRTLQDYAARSGAKPQRLSTVKNWSEQQMAEALQAIEGGMSYRIAATKFNIPRATLQRHTKHYGIKGREIRSWTSLQMVNALQAIQGGMSLSKASSTFHIPTGTLYDYTKRNKPARLPAETAPEVANVEMFCTSGDIKSEILGMFTE